MTSDECPAHVVCVDALPFTATGDTSADVDVLNLFDGYSCGAQNEAGGERVYRVALPGPGTLIAAASTTTSRGAAPTSTFTS